jgi:Tfp pilus assembly protein PilN
VRAVNLIPTDARRSGSAGPAGPIPALAIIGALAVAVAFVTIYVLTTNTIAERQAKIGSLQAQATRANAEAASLTKYTQFEQIAQARAQTVRQIVSTRFDWHAALADLSRVVPANTSLQSLNATVAPGASGAGSAGGGGTSSLRADISAPAFELAGCTSTQDDVARLMSRLRLINGVTRVSLADTQKPSSSGPSTGTSATPVSQAASGGSTGASTGCGANAPTFDLVVFFQPLPGATGSGASTTTPTTGTAGTSTQPNAATTPATGTASPGSGASR